MKRAIIAIVSLLVLAGLLALAWFVGLPAYHEKREERAVSQAQVFLQAGDYRNASLSARQALRTNPNNLAACQVMAVLSEMAGLPQSLDWRRRVAQLDPTVENKLKLAAAGLRYERPPFTLSSQILEQLSPAASNKVAAFHVVSAERALKLNQPQLAEQHFVSAQRLDPTNQLYQLNLAVIRLNSTNPPVAAEARQSLESVRANTNLGPVALRWLIRDSLVHSNSVEALAWSQELVQQPHAIWDDQLQRLAVLKLAASPKLVPTLSRLQAASATNPPAIYRLASWMVNNEFVPDALTWLAELPPDVRTNPPVAIAVADCQIALEQWDELEPTIGNQEWQDMEFLRHAFLSLSCEKQRRTLAAKTHWDAAVRAAGNQLGALTGLLKLADRWERSRDKEDLLWRLADRFNQRWAYQELDRMYLTQGNTRGLNRIYAALLNDSMTNAVLRNNYAATSLLLGANLERAHKLAREVYEEHPEEPGIASTYAYSLHLQGKTDEGIEVLEKFDPDQLKEPSVALYYGVLLSASGDMAKAGPYLEIARQSDRLFPEEKVLLTEAEARR